MLFLEAFEAKKCWPTLKIFATDVDHHAIEKAGLGAYRETIAAEISHAPDPPLADVSGQPDRHGDEQAARGPEVGGRAKWAEEALGGRGHFDGAADGQFPRAPGADERRGNARRPCEASARRGRRQLLPGGEQHPAEHPRDEPQVSRRLADDRRGQIVDAGGERGEHQREREDGPGPLHRPVEAPPAVEQERAGRCEPERRHGEPAERDERRPAVRIDGCGDDDDQRSDE